MYPTLKKIKRPKYKIVSELLFKNKRRLGICRHKFSSGETVGWVSCYKETLACYTLVFRPIFAKRNYKDTSLDR